MTDPVRATEAHPLQQPGLFFSRARYSDPGARWIRLSFSDGLTRAWEFPSNAAAEDAQRRAARELDHAEHPTLDAVRAALGTESDTAHEYLPSERLD